MKAPKSISAIRAAARCWKLRADRSVGVQSTPAKQLALYVTIYSLIRMAADLPENYEGRPDRFHFIKDVPADWEETVGVSAEIGNYAAIARKVRDGTDLYFGVIADENARKLDPSLSFLDNGVADVAEIDCVGMRANFDRDPYDIVIETRDMKMGDSLALSIGRGGGVAVRFRPN